MSSFTRQAVARHSTISAPEPEQSSALNRKCECGKASGLDATCAGCRSKHQGALDSSARSSGSASSGHDFSRVPVFASERYRPNDETSPEESKSEAAPIGSTAAEPQGDINFGEENNPKSTTPVVDKVELVTDSAGAVGGYADDLTCSASLNAPGPFNDTWGRGSIANVHQVQFHVSQGRPDDLRAVRVVNRTANAFGKPWTKNGDDGPPLHEYQYTVDKLVVADAPGWCMPMPEHAFPIDYKADFSIYAYDPLTMKIVASMSYHVDISKAHFSDRGADNHAYVKSTKIGGAVPSPVKKQSQGGSGGTK